MGLTDDTLDGAAPKLETATDPAETARETGVRFIKEHPMPLDDEAPQTDSSDVTAEAPHPEPISTELGTATTLSGRSVLGLDVGTRTLKIVHLQPAGAGIRLLNVEVIPLPPPSDPERFTFAADAVQRFLTDAKPRVRTACCAIGGQGTATACCTMPKMSDKDLANALRWKIAEADSVDADHSTVDSYALDKKRTSGTSEFVVAAAPRDIGKLDAFFPNGNPRLALVVPEPVAIDNIVAATYHPQERGPVAVLDIGTSSARLTITGSHGLEFTRDIPVGGDTITAALAGTVTLADGPVEISRHTAEELKRKYAIGGADLVEAGGVVLPASRILGAIRPVLERLTSEVVRSVQFYGQIHGLAKVESLLICGGGAALSGLADFFSKETRIPTAVLNPWRALGVDVPPDLDADPALFAVATGAAIHDGSKLNLLPAHIRARRTISAVRTISLIVSAVAFLALAGLSYTAAQQAEKLRAVAQLKRESAAPVRAIARKVEIAQSYARALAKRKGILKALGAGRAIHAAVLKELSNIMPEGTYLRSLAFGTTKSVREVRLVVDVYAMPSAGTVRLKQRLIAALEDSPFFVNVSFSPLSSRASGDRRSPDETLQLACQVLGFPGD